MRAQKTCAKIGENKYASLGEALDEAEPGAVITLLKDATENIRINQSITLDLGGRTLSAGEQESVIIVNAGCDVTVQNGTVTGGKGSKITGYGDLGTYGGGIQSCRQFDFGKCYCIRKLCHRWGQEFIAGRVHSQ